MTSPPLHPWRNGFWCNSEASSMLTLIHGEDIEVKNLICLDYPDTKSKLKGKIQRGDYGPAAKEIAELSGVERYNVQWELTSIGFKTPAVLCEQGKLHKGYNSIQRIYSI